MQKRPLVLWTKGDSKDKDAKEDAPSSEFSSLSVLTFGEITSMENWIHFLNTLNVKLLLKVDVMSEKPEVEVFGCRYCFETLPDAQKTLQDPAIFTYG